MARKHLISLSPQRDNSNRKHSQRKEPSMSPPPQKSPYAVPPQNRTRSSGEDTRFASSYGSSGNKAGEKITLNVSRSPTRVRDQIVHHDSPVSSEERSRKDREYEDKLKLEERKPARSSGGKRKESPKRPASYQNRDTADARREDAEMLSEEASLKEVRAAKNSPRRGSLSGERSEVLYPGDVSKLDGTRNSQQKDVRDNTLSDSLVSPHKKRRSPSVDSDSGSEESGKHRAVSEKRKHRRSRRREVASDDSSSESEMEDRKEAKRKKKEEKKLRKEERRRRREGRRQRKEEKRASKRRRKSKDVDALSSDVENNEKDVNASNGERRSRKYSSDEGEMESQKKKLEIELRERALESLRAKKGISR